jgi:hypothetical protein
MSTPDPDAGRDFLTVVPQELWDRYYYALGRFIHMFARFEDSLNASINSFIGARVTPRQPHDHRVVKAATGGQRLAPARDTLKRLFKVTIPLEPTAEQQTWFKARDAEFKRIFDHVGEIHYLRDRIAHNGAVPDMTNKDGWFYTANLITVRDFDQANLVYFKPQTLLNMADDLERIPDLISRLTDPDIFNGLEQQFNCDPSYQASQARLCAPWRHKPSDLKRSG